MTLPLLPGHTFPDPTQTRFHKSQALVFENGGMAIHENAPGIGGTLLPGQLPPKEAISSTTIYNQAMGDSNQEGETVPAWVAFGSQVLRFYGYFKEPVFSSQEETYRVRKVKILFFLEDDTIEIVEPRVKNSGIPQGTFLRRHRAKKDDDSYVNVGDFHIGEEFSLYGRVYFIQEADKFTHEFLDKLNRDGRTDETIPDDPYIQKRTLVEYNETHRNRGVPKPEMLKLRQFLANDGHVLRFYATWDNRDRPFGDLRQFVIHYYLSDDTMEVLEVRHQNDGRDPVPSFVKRGQIPKRLLSLSENDPRFLPAENYFRPTDLHIGDDIQILGRTMHIFDCDPYTRNWYIENMGYSAEEMSPVAHETVEDKPTQVKFEVPPPSLIGSDEDTLRSCISLHPKPAPKDQVKLLKHSNDILRFKCHMVTRNSVDASRSFILTYFMADDTIQVFEPPARNSGIIAGKWLQRTKLTNPDTGKPFQASDFEIGKVLTINCSKFQLDEATEYALSFMEADPDSFPQADLNRIVTDFRAGLKQSGKDATDLFKKFASNNKIDVKGLQSIFEAIGLSINVHEAITIFRRYSTESKPTSLNIRDYLSFAQ
ncbi:MGC84469 protein, putative [Trichomonas vaginalis G3]|uniref:MGC84469 protein, putative n=1 Tax=Trichomonas vaginalis (strain ATCC PRA-98 / G3) TaxID=412133 RepID=A2G584_TRIV3|nr:EF-Hand domain C-terminal containing protein family [Trichomonas vaginalis G3]EAX87685.1 MGC84469 protein, putative [Trichomonas vaginalis G3]KAI5545107.1 EF-Hand domain C-terminal containing protein family [Trichomonas vaginalis G3]|eukprot:XP_001300615.1 MGC84469 protein [Trichomonas vaginalis G3]